VEQAERYKIITVGELGDRLPIGILKDGVLYRDIDARPFTMKHERVLGAIRDKQRQNNVAKFASIVISQLCTKIGHHDFESMKESERLLAVSQMWMPDVYYVYVWLRIRSIGSELSMQLTCPSCANEFQYIGELDTVEVRVPAQEGEDVLSWDYTLRDPFELRNKKVEGFKMGMSRWGSLEPVTTGAFNSGEAKAALIRGSVHEIHGWDSVALGSDELDDMSKYDVENISVSIDENRFGPDLALSADCPRCNQKIGTMIDWGYDSFFSTSSRSRRST